MDFQSAIKAGFQNYFNFKDRASRSEFWYWYLFTLVMSVLVSELDNILSAGGLVTGIWVLFLFIPNISVTVRRLHDIDKSGWWILIAIIPIIGWILLFIWECTKGTNGPNRFGSDPLSIL